MKGRAISLPMTGLQDVGAVVASSGVQTEEYQAQLQMVPPSIGTLLRNAAIDGYQNLVKGVVGSLVFVMSWGPSLLCGACLCSSYFGLDGAGGGEGYSVERRGWDR